MTKISCSECVLNNTASDYGVSLLARHERRISAAERLIMQGSDEEAPLVEIELRESAAAAIGRVVFTEYSCLPKQATWANCPKMEAISNLAIALVRC